jgi:hypothetical protein
MQSPVRAFRFAPTAMHKPACFDQVLQTPSPIWPMLLRELRIPNPVLAAVCCSVWETARSMQPFFSAAAAALPAGHFDFCQSCPLASKSPKCLVLADVKTVASHVLLHAMEAKRLPTISHFSLNWRQTQPSPRACSAPAGPSDLRYHVGGSRRWRSAKP